MKTAIIIPARYASTRLPGKLLLDAGGKPLIRHTYENAARAARADRIIIATDDERIAAAAREFGADVVMTSSAHESGSERIAEAARKIEADIVVNVQGDEPELDPRYIDILIDTVATRAAFAATLVCPFPDDVAVDDPSAVKAVLGKRLGETGGAPVREALYFTRALAPFPRDGAPDRGNYRLHIGVYGFRREALRRFAAAPAGRLERIEKLEQLRILEMGESIIAAEVAAVAAGIDTQADLEAFRRRCASRQDRR